MAKKYATMLAILTKIKNHMTTRLASHFKTQSGFTIVELLIVIVVLAILAALMILGFNGIKERADTTSVKSDLRQASVLLENQRAIDGQYPSSLSGVNNGNGYTPGTGNTIQYTSADGSTFCITVTKGAVVYNKTPSSDPQAGACPGHGGPAPAATVAEYYRANYPTPNTNYPITFSTTIGPSDILVTMLKEHYAAYDAYVSINGTKINPTLTKSLAFGAKTLDITVSTGLAAGSQLSLMTDGTNVEMSYYILRGVNQPTALAYTTAGWVDDGDSGVKSAGFVRTIPPLTLKQGQIGILAVDSTVLARTLYPYQPDPAASQWVVASPSSQLPQSVHIIGTSTNAIPLASSISSTSSDYLAGALLVFGN